MMSADDALNALARRFGVLEEFKDLSGVVRPTARETRLALLRANGLELDNDVMILETLSALTAADAARRYPREIIVERGVPKQLGFGAGAEWRLALEGGAGTAPAGRDRDGIRLPALAVGVHSLFVETGEGSEEITVIAAPRSVPILPDVTGRNRLWGLNAALYGLRSERNLGVGDFGDLAQAARIFGSVGAGFMGINPVHALGWADHGVISPYSPSHRGFLNAMYVAADQIFGAVQPESIQNIISSEGADIAALRASETVPYGRYNERQRRLLQVAFEAFETASNTGEQTDFDRFCAERGVALSKFALFEAISEVHGPDWRNWPEDLQDANGPGAQAMRVQLTDRIRFHSWLQWVAERQLGAAQDQAKTSGMALGLYLDLAVGSRRGGAETWCETETVAQGVSIGAPPDHLSPAGQKWNLAAFSPEKLFQNKYKAFRNTISEAMRYAGVLRIDHVLGLNRSFWIPDDGSPGGYIRQPFEALLAIVAIEAERADTVVIGEDLGLVPQGFREALAARGLYSYSVLQYEKNDEGHFRDPATLRDQSLACFGTHDTPTLKGFWKGRDIDWWQKLGWIDEGKAAELKQGRDREKADLLALDGTNAKPDATFGDVSGHIHGLLARSPAAMVSVQLDDVLGHCEAQNLPGTIDEHPNWRRRCKLPLESFEGDARLKRLGRQMEQSGRGELPEHSEEGTL